MASIFHSCAVIRYPPGFGADRLAHVFDPKARATKEGKVIDFGKAESLIGQLHCEVAEKYRLHTGKEFNRYSLGEAGMRVRLSYYRDRKFSEAMGLLGQEASLSEKINLPWWNEIAAHEAGYSLQNGEVRLVLAQRHSYETQLMRNGVRISIMNVSVGGIPITDDGWIAVGLRGGASYPNTYHVTAGALGLTEKLVENRQKISDFFLEKELAPEFGVLPQDIKGIELGSRVEDLCLEGAATYVFHVRLGMSFEELTKRHEQNKDEDKGEHTLLVGIRDSPAEIWSFIEKHYRGAVRNNPQRKDSEQYLLHPGALALVAYIGGKASDLIPLYREGEW